MRSGEEVVIDTSIAQMTGLIIEAMLHGNGIRDHSDGIGGSEERDANRADTFIEIQ